MTTDRAEQPTPEYVQGHDLLAGKVVVVTAAPAPASARRSSVARSRRAPGVVISDTHERRLAEAEESLAERVRRRPGRSDLRRDRRGAGRGPARRGRTVRRRRRDDQQRRSRRHGQRPGDDRRPVAAGPRRHAHRHVPLHPGGGQRMVDAGKGGVIVNNASVVGWRAQEGQAHYAAAKAGRHGADPLCGDRPRAARDPGQRGRAEPRDASVPGQGHHRRAADELKQREAFGRAAEPWEVANVMVFLASDYASYLTGEVVSVSSQQA